MNAIRSEKVESIEEDNNLAAVSEVEAGIRDFVRNDIAYLRRPAPSTVGGTDAAVDPNAEARRVYDERYDNWRALYPRILDLSESGLLRPMWWPAGA